MILSFTLLHHTRNTAQIWNYCDKHWLALVVSQVKSTAVDKREPKYRKPNKKGLAFALHWTKLIVDVDVVLCSRERAVK